MEKVELIIHQDYDGFFENWTNQLIKELESNPSNTIKKVEVTSGPFRNYGLDYKKKVNTVYLDFYSAVRNGFGSIGISPAELAKIIIE